MCGDSCERRQVLRITSLTADYANPPHLTREGSRETSRGPGSKRCSPLAHSASTGMTGDTVAHKLGSAGDMLGGGAAIAPGALASARRASNSSAMALMAVPE